MEQIIMAGNRSQKKIRRELQEKFTGKGPDPATFLIGDNPALQVYKTEPAPDAASLGIHTWM